MLEALYLFRGSQPAEVRESGHRAPCWDRQYVSYEGPKCCPSLAIALPDSPHTPCKEDTWSAFLNLLDTTEGPSWLQALQLRAVP